MPSMKSIGITALIAAVVVIALNKAAKRSSALASLVW
jgi:hypothetical protein